MGWNLRLLPVFGSVLYALLIWAADTAAQIGFEPLETITLDNHGLWYRPATISNHIYPHGDKLYIWSGYGHFDCYDRNGIYEGQFRLTFENDRYVNEQTTGGVLTGSPHFAWNRDTLIASMFTGTTLHRADGSQIARTAYADFGNSHIFFRPAQPDLQGMMLHASAVAPGRAVSFENKVYMPLTVRENRKLRSRNRGHPPVGDYLLHARNYLNKAPQLACIDLAGPTEGNIRKIKRPFVFAPVDSLAAAQHAQGLYAGYYTRIPALAIDSTHRKLYYTVSSLSHIWIFDLDSLTFDPVQRLAKHQYAAESLAWFRASDMRPFKARGKRDPKNYMDGHNYVNRLSYARSRIDIQLFIDSKNQLLCQVTSQPLSGQDSLFWSNMLLNDSKATPSIDSLRARSLQVYDLAAEGRFVGEIDVPPLFRILEIDSNGDLWAVSGVDATSVTVTRYRLVRGND